MQNLKIFTTSCISAIAIGVAGCAQIPADPDVLPQQDIAHAQLAANIKLARDGWPAAQWWTAYGDQQLNDLLKQSLSASPTLQVAATRIASARAALAVNRADGGFNSEFAGAANRQRYSSNGLLPAPIGGSYFSEQTLQVKASYDFDWWGKHRAQIAASVGEINARRAEYAQAEQTLAAAIVQSYFNLQGSWQRLANQQKIAALQSALVEDKAKRIAHGVANIDEQRLAELELAQVNKQTAQLDAQAAREREGLRALLGADSNALTNLRAQPVPDMPHAMPTRLGVELLARRPDLQAARWRVEASLSRIDREKAAFYPDVNLIASFGLDAISLKHLFEMASRTLFIGQTLSLPLFNSTLLEAHLGTARAARNEMIADYNQSVFDAVRDVAQQGLTVQGIENEIKQQAAATQAGNALLHSAQAKFKQGLADRSTLLTAELVVLKQQDAALQLQTEQVLAEVSLAKALGGGYNLDPSRIEPAVVAHQDKTEK